MPTLPYKLGKLSPRHDERTFTLRSILRAPVRVPAEYSVDVAYPGAPLAMYANDQYGCCVISARANQTVRFELAEQGRAITISDRCVVGEYFRESGGSDSGLVMLYSLNEWRLRGWRVGRRVYRIMAFASIDPHSKSELQQVVFANLGCQVGLALPVSCMDEFAHGKPWSTTTGAGTKPGSLGGHAVYVVGYTQVGPVCLTWGQRQQMTWAWYRKYCDEAWATIDAVNTTRKKRLLDAGRIRQLLAAL